MSILKADRDLVALTVLALLQTGPRHAYEMLLMVERTHKDFVTGLPRSIYHAADRLAASGLIEAVGTARDGTRPARTVFQLTSTGRARLRDWVRLLLEEPDADSSLFGPALTYAASLSATEVAAALQRRSGELQAKLSMITESRRGLTPTVPRVLLLKLEYHSSRLEAEIAWVADVITELTAGDLAWPDEVSRIADIDPLIAEDDPDR